MKFQITYESSAINYIIVSAPSRLLSGRLNLQPVVFSKHLMTAWTLVDHVLTGVDTKRNETAAKVTPETVRGKREIHKDNSSLRKHAHVIYRICFLNFKN